MNKFLTILSGLMLFSLQAAELQVLSAEQLKAKVAEITVSVTTTTPCGMVVVSFSRAAV